MVWNSELVLLIPDPTRGLALVCGVDCYGGACWAWAWVAMGLLRVSPFPSLFLSLTPHDVRRTLPAK